MKSLRVVMAALVMTAGSMAQAQTADEIANKHIDAIGGKDKLAAIKTIYTEYDMDVMGTQAPGVTYILNGKGYRNEMDFGGQKIIQVFTDKGGWSINPMMGQTSPEPLPEDQVKANKGSLDAGGPLYNYAAKGGKLELNGTEKIGSVEAHKLKLTTADGPEMMIFIDPTTYYILKTVIKAKAEGQDVETTLVFSDYKKTDFGYVSAGTTELNLPQGFSVTIKAKKVEINKEIDPKIFEMQ
jgi:outer membrane lipoprotein-sorting protein